jgi:Protein of unknown function (DUF2911)
MLKLTKSLVSGLVLIAFAAIQYPAQAQKPSPAAETSVAINGKKITIKYSAPSMRGRKIFGGLVPYGQVWRAGADEATSLTTEAALDINGLKVPAGSYTLYVLPEANQWQLIINKQTGQWGTVYNEKQDLGRVMMTLNKASAPVETYKMTLSSAGGNKGKLTLEWDSTVASVPFTVQ